MFKVGSFVTVRPGFEQFSNGHPLIPGIYQIDNDSGFGFLYLKGIPHKSFSSVRFELIELWEPVDLF